MKNSKFVKYSTISLAVIGFFVSVFEKFIPNLFPQDWYIPIIFAILVSLVVYIIKISDIEDTIHNLDGKIQASGFQKYSRFTDFYDALNHELGNSHSELLLTHIRNNPPSKFSVRSKYFDTVDKWAKSHPDALVKRLASPSNAEMKQYCKDEIDKSESTPNYYFRVIEKPVELSIFQLAILDRKKVFITIPGGFAQQTRAIFIDDPDVIQFCIDYFDNLWRNSREGVEI